MATHYEIAKAFVKGYGPKRGHSVFRSPDIKGRGETIYSYGMHFPMAHRMDENKLFLVNGDRYSHSTNTHQSHVRGAITYRSDYESPYKDYKVLTVPFTAIDRIKTLHHSYLFDLKIKIIDVGFDEQFIYCFTCDKHFDSWNGLDHHRRTNTGHKTRYFHKLAPSTFMMQYHNTTPVYFISGFDETANSNSDGYFLSVLPGKPRNIAHAFEMLKPRQVKEAEKNGIKVLRQGDIFAIPTDKATRKLNRNATIERPDRYHKKVWAYWAPEATVTVVDYPNLLNTSHCATEVINTGKTIYARGVLRHRPTDFGRTRPEHININLGKKWHRIYRNTALASYSLGGRVD